MLATAPREAIYERPFLYDQQERALFGPARYALIESSTKAGKTVGALVWLTEQAMRLRAGQNVWWLAPIYAQSKIAFRRLKRMLPQGLYTANESELTITLGNGAVIWFKSAEKPDALYGEDVFAAVVDEASRTREEAFHALRSTLTATRGPLRLIGNVRGRRNWFWRMCRRAESGEAGLSYARITWRDAVKAGVLQLEEIEDARKQLPPAVFRELYEAEASDDEGNPFGHFAIAAGTVPMSDQPPVCFGADLAKSTDWTVVIGLDASGVVCRFQRFQKPWEETLRSIEQGVGDLPALVDSTGVGDPIVEQLQRRGAHVTGFQFSSQSKQRLMEGLAVALQRGEVGFPPGPIPNELEAFEYEYSRTGVRYTAPAGMHDDCVCALALAVQCRAELMGSVPRIRVLA